MSREKKAMPKAKPVVISPTQASIDPGSVCDPHGFVFYHDNRVCRAIHPDAESRVRKLLEHPNFEDLFEHGLVRTRIVDDIQVEGYPLVLEHERVPFVSHCGEWPMVMLREAALVTLNLSLELARMGYAIKDGHPWNVLFDRCRPVFVDVGSIVPLNASFSWPYEEFRNHFLMPMWLFHRWREDVAYKAMGEHPAGAAKTAMGRGLLKLFPLSYARYAAQYRIGRKRSPQKALEKMLSNLIGLVRGYDCGARKGKWSDYAQTTGTGDVDNPDTYSPKARSVYTALKKIGPGTVLDMACNKGWYSYMATELGNQVVAFDYEPTAVSEVFHENRGGLRNILPLRMDFLYPTPPFGVLLGGRSSFDRFRCDTTMVLALVHHLVFGQGVGFRVIAETIDRYTITHAIVEFIPADDIHVSQWMTDEYGWYTMDNFIDEMKRFFSHVEVMESSPDPRKILVFSR